MVREHRYLLSPKRKDLFIEKRPLRVDRSLYRTKNLGEILVQPIGIVDPPIHENSKCLTVRKNILKNRKL